MSQTIRYVVSDEQPLCRFCGKKLAKDTLTHRPPGVNWYGGKGEFEGMTEPPRTREELDRLTNAQIVNVEWNRDDPDDPFISGFSTWDGETYKTRWTYFCSTTCAGRWAMFTAREMDELKGKLP